MNIFYDLETTGLDSKHQILSACFVKTDDNFEITEILNFNVALNSLEIPAESAIAVNSVDITKHMIDHKNKFDNLISEEEFARQINTLFLKTLQYGHKLIGYNSNKFDIKHIRKVLIKYGYNPYYNYNKFEMVDILNHVKYLRLTKRKIFDGIENLKLSSVFKHLIGEEAKGQHEAESDVLNCVTIAKHFVEHHNWKITERNDEVNNLFTMCVKPGDEVVLANPYSKTSKDIDAFIRYQVQDVTKNYILLKNLEPEKYENNHHGIDQNDYRVINKNDFCLAKLVLDVETPIKGLKTVDQYYAEFEDKGIENFIYGIKFGGFDELARVRSHYGLDFDTTSNELNQIKASQIFSRVRPIRHKTNGVQYDEILETESFRKFFVFYYDKYLKEEMDKTYPEADEKSKVIKLIRDYKSAYKELYEVLSQ